MTVIIILFYIYMHCKLKTNQYAQKKFEKKEENNKRLRFKMDIIAAEQVLNLVAAINKDRLKRMSNMQRKFLLTT